MSIIEYFKDKFFNHNQYSNQTVNAQSYTKKYYHNCILHKLNGPAVENYDGSKEYWVNGELHRLDGPAIEYIDGYNRWFINGKEYSEEDYNKEIQELFRIPINNHFV